MKVGWSQHVMEGEGRVLAAQGGDVPRGGVLKNKRKERNRHGVNKYRGQHVHFITCIQLTLAGPSSWGPWMRRVKEKTP